MRKGKTMSEYISKEEINRVLLNRIDMNNKCLIGARESKHFEEEKYFSTLIFEDEQIKALFEESAPSADVRPNIHGHWVDEKVGRWFAGDIFKCSECGNTLNRSGVNCGRGDANFCPNCGADMREPIGEKGETC